MNIKIKIDVTKINKSKLYKGAKGTYLNAVLIDKPTQYNDFMIVEETTEEERKVGKKGEILGNGSYIHAKEQAAQQTAKQDENPFNPINQDDNDLPF